DTQVLQQALKDSNGSLELAVAFLTAKNAKIPQQEETTYYQTALPGNDRYISVGSQADTNVIDLTGDDKDDLQRAIALSLEESNRAFRETGITDEEQAISRVLEASIAENKASLKRTHPEVWSDSPNPYDRKRQDNCPVGLKNVGNTCWFSAVIQSLFNLLEFRRLVLNYSPPGSAQDLPRNQKVKSHRDLSYEFTHKLLDWLEDAFQIKAEEEQDGEKPKNPMVELFYGRFLAVGVLEGKKFENAEMFGQYPLQVNGFKDLHECLEAAMVEGEIESLHSENSGKSGQEVSDMLRLLETFVTLPVMLTGFTIPAIGGAVASPSTSGCTSSFLSSTTEQQGPSTEMQSTSPAQRSVIHKPFTQSRIPPDLPMHPAPRHITEEELSVLEGCLHRWRTEVENDTRDLQESIARIQRTIELMYSDKSMVQVPYRLHAVLVHEGQANAGHYWAYIYDSYQRRWMKYNDISVTRSTWEELERDSFGGYRNASAYCLMYINDKEPFLIQEEFNKETGQMVVGIDTLPPDLRDYVREDNKRFEKELEEWDAQIALKAQEEKALISQTARVPVPFTARGEDPEYLEQPSRTDVSKQLKEDSIRAITKAFTEQEDKNPETVMNVAIKSEYARLLKLAQEDTPPECDYRLHHAIVYFILNQAPKKIIERTLLEQFADHNLSFDERCRNIMKVAQAKIGMIKPGEVNMEDYEWWHQEYKNFRETTVYLIFQEALLYLIFAYHKNKELSSRGLYRGHDEELISHYRRECLLKLNECAAAQFESGDDNEVNKGLEIMNELIVPCLPLLLVDETEEKDIVAVEDMRNRWCSYLGQEMEPNLQEKLTDFLPKLLDCSTEIKGFNDPPKLPSYSTHELCERFARIMLSLSRTPADGR
uniref:Ubiquitin carboxyl-terminal hydrolase n=1 Tax=Anolis carolinensis TaxID=28377 RepID=A0A803TRY2_ANOCA